MKHALVVGGTGMLSEVCMWLDSQNYHVSVIGRNTEKMSRLIEQVDKGKITSLLVDYNKVNLLDIYLKQTIHENGPITLVVAWVHTGGEQGLTKIIEIVAEPSEPWELYHVLGSRAKLSQVKRELYIPVNCHYFQVQLGFKLEEDRGRWLNNHEIADGVIKAIQRKDSTSLVGVLEPANLRP
ncbi:short-chain dehydrogenase [Bacillus sp. RO2]|uniref:short-chain dehydrogenase n=1 Tax=Bacillus sp. RO2 TaxID=2723913 RepID=UPI00145CDD78|nr:short-chain dehydrogenase [Bacillus sp. RO2]NMH72172.1 short-chain dehydrogenase [Bacillus sp. RO2]